MTAPTLEYDVFIAGSGPVGATYARLVADHHKTARILMVEVGAQESATIGSNLKNAIKYQKDLDSFRHVIRSASQQVSLPPVGGYLPGLQGDAWMQPESRSSINSPYNPDQNPATNLYSGGWVTRAVGGASTHWTCACPEPHDEELVLCPIERPVMRDLLQRGKKLLNVHEDQFENSVRHQLVKKALSDSFGPGGRVVKSLPLAGERSKENGEYIAWSAADTVLGDTVTAKDESGKNRFTLLAETLVIKFITEEHKVIGALVKDLRSGKERIVKAKVYVAACGVICTPQLLWNSNIRHKALGCYLTGQSHTFCQIVLRRTLIETLRISNLSSNADSANTLPIPLNDPDPQVTIPYSTEYPYHTQIHCDAFSYGDIGPEIDHRVVVDIRFFAREDIQESNRITFSNTDRDGRPNTDLYGMPQATFHYERSRDDEQRAQKMMKDMCDVSSILGSYLPTALPHPKGFMRRYDFRLEQLYFILKVTKGPTRIGKDSHTSVANESSRVRVDENTLFDNLWVGGCSVIPDSTACNPTLTAVAYAIKGADDMTQVLGEAGFLNGLAA
ncbi:GMC oxidoreductase [Ceratobasidium sp. AG-Ba]|nr:GMC oxidoreductase [Ceratobasidium sp. AG-Ba]